MPSSLLGGEDGRSVTFCSPSRPSQVVNHHSLRLTLVVRQNTINKKTYWKSNPILQPAMQERDSLPRYDLVDKPHLRSLSWSNKPVLLELSLLGNSRRKCIAMHSHTQPSAVNDVCLRKVTVSNAVLDMLLGTTL